MVDSPSKNQVLPYALPLLYSIISFPINLYGALVVFIITFRVSLPIIFRGVVILSKDMIFEAISKKGYPKYN